MKKKVFLLILGIALFVPVLHGQENCYHQYRKLAIRSAAGVPWSATRHLSIVEAGYEATQMMDQSLIKHYPIQEEDLLQIYQLACSNTIPFFAYSCMIDRKSNAAQEISHEAVANQKPAIAFGIQRTFNRQMETLVVEKGWGPLSRPNDLAVLNIFEKKDAVLNGVIFHLPYKDLLILSERKVGYNLVAVPVMYWSDAKDEQKEPEIFFAYTFQAGDGAIGGVHYTNSNINPIPGYFDYLQIGIDSFGQEFEAMWWSTTYLADQKTVVNELPYQSIDLKKD